MNILTLSLKQKYFDEILARTKKIETREIRPNNSSRYGNYILNEKSWGKFSEIPKEFSNDENLQFELIKYDAIKFLTGEYKGRRPYLIIRVTEEKMFTETDSDENPIIYTFRGDEYALTTVDYHLGEILEIELYK